MDDRIDDVVVTVVAASEPVDPDRGKELLGHLADAEVPENYSHRITNAAGVDPELLEAAKFVFADHAPSTLDVTEEPPRLFSGTYREDGRVEAAFRSEYDALTEFLDVVEHLLSETTLTVEHFRVVVDLTGDVTDLADVADSGAPTGYALKTKVHPSGERSAVGVERLDEERLEESADPLREWSESVVAHVTGMLP